MAEEKLKSTVFHTYINDQTNCNYRDGRDRICNTDGTQQSQQLIPTTPFVFRHLYTQLRT